MRGFQVGACPEAVAIDASAMNEIERMSADVVENFIESKSVEHWSGQAHAIPDSIRHPESPRWRASLTQNSNPVENYLRLIGEEIHG